ncbi:MAG: hypothetical protein ACOCVL_02850 [Candidatus Sumerlaeota bacterium]
MLDPLPEPQNDPEIMRRVVLSQWLWKACLGFPFLYLLIAWGLEKAFFQGYGFWPLHSETYMKVLAGFIAAAVTMQVILFFIHRHFTQKILDYRLRPHVMATALWRRTMYGAMCGDTVSALGLVLFLFNADWSALIFFCLGSYVLYGQITPHLPRELEQRRPDKKE